MKTSRRWGRGPYSQAVATLHAPAMSHPVTDVAALGRRWYARIGLGDMPALEHEGFRLLWRAQMVSLIGTTMHNAAVLWHVAILAESGHRAIALGLLGLARAVPLLGLALIGGVACDRFDRRKVMLVTQSVLGGLAALLAILTITGTASLLWLYAITALKAAATAFDSPARSSLMPRLVPREHLPNAVSLNTTLFQVTSLVGPALTGILLICSDLSWIYALNALSFVAVIQALARIKPLPRIVSDARVRGSVFEGLGYIFANPLVRSSTLLDFFASFFGSATVLLPIFAAEVLQVGSVGFGCLCAAPSVGAVTASFLLLRLESRIERHGVLLLWSIGGYGIATILFGLSTTFVMALICLAATGACDTINMVLRNVIKQLATPDALRGRMNGAQILFAQGGPQLGELEAGIAAQAMGAPLSVIGGGLGCLAITAWIAWMSPELRRCGSMKAPAAAPAMSRAA